MPWLWVNDWGNGVKFLAGGEDFSLLHNIQISFEVHPASYPTDTGGSSLRIQWLWHKDDHPIPSSSEIKNTYVYSSTPPYVFMEWCLNKHRDNFNFSYNWVNRILSYLWLVPAGKTLTALMSNCNWSCVHGAEPFLLLPAAPEPPPQARVADSISSCRSRSMRRSVSSIACRKATRPSCANLVTSSSNLEQ